METAQRHGLGQSLQLAIDAYAVALHTQDFRNRELAAEFLDGVLESVVRAEVKRRVGPNWFQRAYLWVRRQWETLMECIP